MLNLNLRPEFQGKTLKGTVIELTNRRDTGAIQQQASAFLEITYPSIDLMKMAEAIQPDQGRTIVLKGGRGQGKSHMMAAAFHLLTDETAAGQWRDFWADRLNDEALGNINFRTGFNVIAQALHKQEHKFLWDAIFENHPKGEYIRGKWEARGTDIPSHDDMTELFDNQPTVLIFDEFQTWYDGLTNTKQHPRKNWAFNFIQILSEVAEQNPDKLALIVSVRDGDTDAYQQIHRVNPVVIDFTGPLVKRDRRRLLLYRMFENRYNISEADIESHLAPHFSEYCRLRQIAGSETDREKLDFIESWPFSPRLLQLLDDQVLVATEAQETRDLIKLLVETFKVVEDSSPVITAADFRIDIPQSAVGSLIDSVANQLNRDLREKALRNLQNIKETVKNPSSEVPHAAEIISSLWLRSLAAGHLAGALPRDIQIDITRNKPVDENAFQSELSLIRQGSFNIHEAGDRLIFKNEENNEAKLIAHARNDRQFDDGSDIDYLAKMIHSLLAGHDQSPYRVIVLRKNWQHNPWDDMPPEDHPQQWDKRIPIIVLPEYPDNEHATLGEWVATHLSNKRNTPRFLMPQKGSTNIFRDRNILIDARAAKLASEWKTSDKSFTQLQSKFERETNSKIKAIFSHFAIMDTWDYNDPKNCRFQIAKHGKTGQQTTNGIQSTILETHFIPEDFDDLVLDVAKNNTSLHELFAELQEPLSKGQHSIPWIGEAEVKDCLEHMIARGVIAINLRGSTLLQAGPAESKGDAYHRIRGKLSNINGTHLKQTTLQEPQAAGATGGYVAPVTPDVGGLEVPGNGTTTPPTNPFSGGGGGGGGSSPTVVPPSPTHSRYSAEPNSPLNLCGKVESWGVSNSTKVTKIEISTTDFTGKQLEDLLRKLPEGKYSLDLEKEDNS